MIPADMEICEATRDRIEPWTDLRVALWPHHTHSELKAEAGEILGSSNQNGFLANDQHGQVVGFIECALHQGSKGPYAHVEGWFVSPSHRGQGLGQALMSSVEQWCLHRSIDILTSDTEPDYPLSPEAHARAGFRQLHQLTIFIRDLK